MEEKKIWTLEDEFEAIFNTNIRMLNEEGIIYIPDFRCIKTVEFNEARFNHSEKGLYIAKIYPYIISPEYRAEQRLLYEQLPIFQGLKPLLDEALQAFYEEKYICSYFALVPVIEGLLLRWSGEKPEDFDFRKFIKSKTKQIANNTNCDLWCKHNLRLLRRIITDFFFKESTPESMKHMFNRNVVSHLLTDPTYFESQKNTLRLLTIIDLIANCYTYDFKLDGGGEIRGNGWAISCYKYFELGQERIQNITNLYFKYNLNKNMERP